MYSHSLNSNEHEEKLAQMGKNVYKCPRSTHALNHSILSRRSNEFEKEKILKSSFVPT